MRETSTKEAEVPLSQTSKLKTHFSKAKEEYLDIKLKTKMVASFVTLVFHVLSPI